MVGLVSMGGLTQCDFWWRNAMTDNNGRSKRTICLHFLLPSIVHSLCLHNDQSLNLTKEKIKTDVKEDFFSLCALVSGTKENGIDHNFGKRKDGKKNIPAGASLEEKG